MLDVLPKHKIMAEKSVTERLFSFTLSVLHYSTMFKLYLGNALTWLYTSVFYVLKHKGTKLVTIQEDAQTLSKIPLHIAFLVNLNEDQLNFDNLAKITVWALASGINTVSLYHHNDILNCKFSTLSQAIVKYHQVLYSSTGPQLEVISGNKLLQGEKSNSHEGSGSSHTVLILSPNNGRQRIAELARSLSTSVINKQLRVEDIDHHKLSDQLTLTNGIPDPDLALMWGDTSSTLGYPPWQLRLTEIQTLEGIGKVTYYKFFQSLQRFAKCQQRFGK